MSKKWFAKGGVYVVVILIWVANAYGGNSTVRPLGMEALAHLEYLPFFYPVGTQTLQFFSHGSFSKTFLKYIDKNGEYVIFDAYGPGCLCRQNFNTRWVFDEVSHKLVLAGVENSRIRFYFDDERTPRIDATVSEFFDGKNPTFSAPFSFTGDFKDYKNRDFVNTRVKTTSPAPTFTAQYYPILFAKRLKVALLPSKELKRFIDKDVNEHKDNIAAFYQYTYQLYPPGTKITSWAGDVPSSVAARAVLTKVGEDPKPLIGNTTTQVTVTVAPGETKALLDAQGQGSVASIKLHLSPYNEETFFGVRLRMRWDWPDYVGEDVVDGDVDMPVGSFFGGGSDAFANRSKIPGKKLTNLFYGFDGTQGTFYSYWPMPYWKSAKVEITNNSSVPVAITALIEQTPKEKFAYPRGAAGYFYAKQTKYADRGDDLYATGFHEWGSGHVVGKNFFSEKYCEEGDELTYFDGARGPQIRGNGTEDDLDQGWDGTDYQQALWGALLNGFQGAYRLYLTDSYVFNREIHSTHELHDCSGTDAKTDVVTYYYKVGWFRSGFVETDALDVGIPKSEKAHDYEVVGQTWSGSVRSSYDGYVKNPRAVTVLEEGRAFKGHSSFTVSVDPNNEGVRLRRLVSRSGNGMQVAEVFVDGVKVARPWLVLFNPTAPETQAWVDSEFELPSALTRGKSKLRIEVHYLNSTAGEINEFHYWVFSHVPLSSD